jgi:hypothetical protein
MLRSLLCRRKAFTDLGSCQNSPRQYADHEQVGIFPLRSCFASRISYSAQDDSA